MVRIIWKSNNSSTRSQLQDTTFWSPLTKPHVLADQLTTSTKFQLPTMMIRDNDVNFVKLDLVAMETKQQKFST